MSHKVVQHPDKFLDSLGGLHDAEIQKINVDVESGALSVNVTDLNSNFDGMPNYAGRRPARLIFSNVDIVNVIIDVKDGVVISFANVKTYDKHFELIVDLRYGGITKAGGSIIVNFSSMSVDETP